MREETVRFLLCHAFGERPAEGFGNSPIRLRAERHDHVQPLAAGRAAERCKAKMPQPVPDLMSRFDNVRPGHAFAGVEIEHELIGAGRVRLGRAPGVQLDRRHLRH
jgi:hypothetical protein